MTRRKQSTRPSEKLFPDSQRKKAKGSCLHSSQYQIIDKSEATKATGPGLHLFRNTGKGEMNNNKFMRE